MMSEWVKKESTIDGDSAHSEFGLYHVNCSIAIWHCKQLICNLYCTMIKTSHFFYEREKREERERDCLSPSIEITFTSNARVRVSVMVVVTSHSIIGVASNLYQENREMKLCYSFEVSVSVVLLTQGFQLYCYVF